MRPDPPSPIQRRFIAWFFGASFCVALVFIAWGWHLRTQECIVDCQAQGFADGTLAMHGGSRLTFGSHCECAATSAP